MRSGISLRTARAEPPTSSAGRETVDGGVLPFRALAIDRCIFIPDNCLCQLAFSLINSMKLKPAELSAALHLLEQGDWKAAHEIVQKGRAFPRQVSIQDEIKALKESL